MQIQVFEYFQPLFYIFFVGNRFFNHNLKKVALALAKSLYYLILNI